MDPHPLLKRKRDTDAAGMEAATSSVDSASHHGPPAAGYHGPPASSRSSLLPLIPTIVRFDYENVDEVILNNKWGELIDYLHDFLAKVQVDNLHSHLGLLLPVYEAHTSTLVKNGDTVKAKAFFKEKVEPLANACDFLHQQTILHTRLKKLRDIVNSSMDFSSVPQSHVSEAVYDYVALHFPEYTKVKFEGELVQQLLDHHQWDMIEKYLMEFLANVQSDWHSHPGLMCSFFEAYILHLIEEGKFDDAKEVFNVKVKPLGSDIDSLYRPIDLQMHINLLENIVNESCVPTDFVQGDVKVVILDYVRLYFADSIGDIDQTTSNSVKCFTRLHTFNKERHYVCLACRWSMFSNTEISHHIKHTDPGHICCPKVTNMMLRRIAAIERTNVVSIEDIDAGYLNAYLKDQMKKKVSEKSSTSESVSSPWVSLSNPLEGLENVSVLHNLNGDALKLLVDAKEPAEVESRNILAGQHKLMSELRQIFVDALKNSGQVTDAYQVVKKVNALLDSQRDIYQIVTKIPVKVASFFARQDRILCDMRCSYLFDVVTHCSSDPIFPILAGRRGIEQSSSEPAL